MKIVNDFLEKHGVDKLLHFLVAAYIVLAGSLNGFYGLIIAWVILIPLMFIKEKIDAKEGGKFDYADIIWGAMGGVVSTVIYLLSLLPF